MFAEKTKIRVKHNVPEFGISNRLKNKYLNIKYGWIIAGKDHFKLQKHNLTGNYNTELAEVINIINQVQGAEYFNLLKVYNITEETLRKHIFKVCLESDIDNEFRVFVINDITQIIIQEILVNAPINNGIANLDIVHLSNKTKQKIQTVLAELGLCKQDILTYKVDRLQIEISEENFTAASEEHYFKILDSMGISKNDFIEKLTKLNILSKNYDKFISNLADEIFDQMPYSNGLGAVTLSDFTKSETLELSNKLLEIGIIADVVLLNGFPVGFNLRFKEKEDLENELILGQNERKDILDKINISNFILELKGSKQIKPLIDSRDLENDSLKLKSTAQNRYQNLIGSIYSDLSDGFPTQNIFSCLMYIENDRNSALCQAKIESKANYKLFVSLFYKYFPKQFFKIGQKVQKYDKIEKVEFYIDWKL